MAKKTPADWKKEGDALKAVVIAAKKKPQNFALVELKEGMCLCAHALHPISKLMLEAKKADGAKKANCVTGQLKLNGKEFVFDCNEAKLPGGMDIKFKQYLKKADHGAFKATFNLTEEEDKDSVQADEEQAAAQSKPKATEPEDQAAQEKTATNGDEELSKEQLSGNFEHISEIFELSFEGMDEKQAEELKAALKAIGGAIASGDLTSAQNMMNQLGLLTGVTASSPKEPITLAASKKEGDDLNPAELKKKKKELTKSLADLKPDLQKATVQSDPAGQTALQDLIKQFQKQFKANEVDDAEESLDELKAKVGEFLEAQENATLETADEDQADDEDNLPPEAREQRDLELDDLESSIDALIAEMGGMDSLEQTDGI